jgi:tetratricopeptide (TPR) repeat protein
VRWIAAAALLASLACARPSEPTPAATPVAEPSSGVAALLALGDAALAEGDAARALDRFERAFEAAPDVPETQIGVGRALAALGRADAARAALEAGLAGRPDSAAAHEALADLAIARGDRDTAAAHLERVFGADPSRIDAHRKLAELTGPAPSGGDPVARADAHPYDPGARLAAGEALLEAGRPDAAREHLESALVLADLDPAAAQQAFARLAAAFPDWRARRIVWVRVWADEPLRADPSWKFQQRIAWLLLSTALDPLLHTRFLVAEIGAFRSEGSDFDDLDAIQAKARAQVGPLPPSGIAAFMTGRPVPRIAGAWKQGQAEFLGRTLSLRIAPGEVASRVLAHEAIHLYGGVHVNPDVESLMNPAGRSTAIDPWNAAILRALSARRFGPGGLETNVLDAVPLAAVIQAYGAALQANLALRKAGVLEALEGSGGSLRGASFGVQRAIALDAHLGDVASFVAELLRREGKPRAAARLFEIAAQLYGAGDARGRRALDRARALRPAAAG